MAADQAFHERARRARTYCDELATCGHPIVRRGLNVGILAPNGKVTTWRTRDERPDGWTPVAAAELTDRQAAYAISALRRMHP